MRKPYFSLFFIIFIFCSAISAQKPTFQPVPRPGLTPAEIRDADAAADLFKTTKTGPGGQLVVAVRIDEAGNAFAIGTVSGPGNVCPSVMRSDILEARQAAGQAAQLVRFNPAKVDGVPFSSHGSLYFDSGPTPEDTKVEVKSDEPRTFTAIGSPPNFKGHVSNSGAITPSGDTQPVKVVPPDQQNINQPPIMSRPIQGGVLNGKARSLPKPPYPPAARAVRAEGPVTVQVLIDEDGNIFSASAVSGHPLLRSASRLAACEARFSPTLLSGQPVKVVGTITYNFVAP